MKNAPGTEELTDLLDVWEEEIKSVSRLRKQQKKAVTIEYLKSHLSFINKQDDDFFSIWDLWTAEHSDKWTESTQKRYAGCKKKLQEVDKFYKIEFDSLGNDFLLKFKKYHQDEGHNNSYTHKNLVILIGFLAAMPLIVTFNFFLPTQHFGYKFVKLFFCY